MAVLSASVAVFAAAAIVDDIHGLFASDCATHELLSCVPHLVGIFSQLNIFMNPHHEDTY